VELLLLVPDVEVVDTVLLPPVPLPPVPVLDVVVVVAASMPPQPQAASSERLNQELRWAIGMPARCARAARCSTV
jgi:hypothetical protein